MGLGSLRSQRPVTSFNHFSVGFGPGPIRGVCLGERELGPPGAATGAEGMAGGMSRAKKRSEVSS